MKKRAALFLLGCLIALFLVGCNASVYKGSSDAFIAKVTERTQEQDIGISLEGDLTASDGKVFKRMKVSEGEGTADLVVVNSPQGEIAEVILSQQAPLSGDGVARVLLSTIQPKEDVDDLLSQLMIGTQEASNGNVVRGEVSYTYVNDGSRSVLTIKVKNAK